MKGTSSYSTYKMCLSWCSWQGIQKQRNLRPNETIGWRSCLWMTFELATLSYRVELPVNRPGMNKSKESAEMQTSRWPLRNSVGLAVIVHCMEDIRARNIPIRHHQSNSNRDYSEFTTLENLFWYSNHPFRCSDRTSQIWFGGHSAKRHLEIWFHQTWESRLNCF